MHVAKEDWFWALTCIEVPKTITCLKSSLCIMDWPLYLFMSPFFLTTPDLRHLRFLCLPTSSVSLWEAMDQTILGLCHHNHARSILSPLIKNGFMNPHCLMIFNQGHVNKIRIQDMFGQKKLDTEIKIKMDDSHASYLSKKRDVPIPILGWMRITPTLQNIISILLRYLKSIMILILIMIIEQIYHKICPFRFSFRFISILSWTCPYFESLNEENLMSHC